MQDLYHATHWHSNDIVNKDIALICITHCLPLLLHIPTSTGWTKIRCRIKKVANMNV